MYKFLFAMILTALLTAACVAQPTATPMPPTAAPPTVVPPTTVPPTAVPPTAVPPTAVPPTAVPLTPVPPTAVLPNASCPTATTLESLVACIANQMPGRGSEGYIVPDNTVLTDWRSVVAQMLKGECDKIALPASLRTNYAVKTLSDGGKGYCVLMEVMDADSNGKVDKGWGTFVINNNPKRELSIQAPHVLSDLNTETQAIGVFKETDSRTLLLTGSHREANATASPCTGTSYKISDAAHNSNAPFHATLQELIAYYDARKVDFTALQFHGMAADSCPGHVYLSYGVATPPVAGDKILTLKANVLKYHSDWIVTVPGDTPACTLNATQNVQGRLLNKVPAENACTVAATGYTGKFIHIEQDPNQRNAKDWIAAINEAWQ